jgi:hypothetical protein
VRAPAFSFLFAAALLLAGCHHTPVVPDGGTPQCETREDCDAGYICNKDQICTNCTSSGQCALRELCDPKQALCVFRPGWGDQCSQNAQCQAGQYCVQGLCVASANVQLCPDGTSSECPTGMRCNSTNLVCEQNLGCLANDDCDPGETCNTGLNACEPTCSVMNQAQQCQANETCSNGLCVECTQSSDCTGVGLVCDSAGLCSSGTQCYSDRDCEIPLVCYEQTGQCVPQLPPCNSDEDCGTGQECDIATGQCVSQACQPDRLGPNNTPDAAYGAAPGTYTGLTLCNGETDYFSFQLNRGDDLGVDVDTDPFAEPTFTTRITDVNGVTLASGHLIASYVAPAQGLYLVGISSTDLEQFYDVSFLISQGTPCSDPYVANASPSQAFPLNATTTVDDGQVCPGDQNWFSLPVPADAGVSVSLTDYDSQNGLLQLCLQEGTTVLGCSEDLTTPNVTATASQVGGTSVLIQVEGSTNLVSNSYTLQAVFQ